MAKNCRWRSIGKADLLDNKWDSNYFRNRSTRCCVDLQHSDFHLLHLRYILCVLYFIRKWKRVSKHKQKWYNNIELWYEGTSGNEKRKHIHNMSFSFLLTNIWSYILTNLFIDTKGKELISMHCIVWRRGSSHFHLAYIWFCKTI